jgi:hypothetical protein
MLTRMTGLLAAGVLLAAMLTAASPAAAEVWYPWCATYAAEDGDGGTNCGFVTVAQCRASVSGVGGVCYENPARAPARLPKIRKPRHKT